MILLIDDVKLIRLQQQHQIIDEHWVFNTFLVILKAEERALNSPKQSGYSVKSPDKSGQNFTLQMGVYTIIIYTH